jgi:hypothetical protein
MHATTFWRELRGKRLMTVYGGTYRSDKRHGAIEVVWSYPCTGPQQYSVDTTDAATGPLTLTTVRGSIVSFTFSGGHGKLDFARHHFQLTWSHR